MKVYRLFYMDVGGKLTFEEITAENDEDAVQLARDMKLGVNCQVWDRQKLVATIPRDTCS